jgi:hypothetical protein
VDFDPGTPLTHSPISVCSDTGFRVEKLLAQCNIDIFRGSTPSLTLRLTIRLSLSTAYLVTSIHIKFSSDPAANLWSGWIVQLIHNSLPWHTHQNDSKPKYFLFKKEKSPAFLAKYLTFSKNLLSSQKLWFD